MRVLGYLVLLGAAMALAGLLAGLLAYFGLVGG